MNRTYVTNMPDNTGAFLKACKVINESGGNIIRVNYNKTVDVHFLFIEVSGTEKQHFEIQERLIEIGYLSNEIKETRLVLISLQLNDIPGAIIPVLEVIDNHKINISYMNSHADGSQVQNYKMGLLIEKQEKLPPLLNDIEKICPVKILDYEVAEKNLDGSVFYYTYANEISSLLGLSHTQTASFIVNSNKIMQFLEEKNESPMKTFKYIHKFAKFIKDHHGENLHPNVSTIPVSDDTTLYLIQVACGSNTAIFKNGKELLFIDSGFGCYTKEMNELFHFLFDDFDQCKKTIMLTHGDIDHTGDLDSFDKAYMVQSCYENFKLEHEEKPNFREMNKFHAPYCRLSKIIIGYKLPTLTNVVIIGNKTDDAPLSKVGEIDFKDLHFDVLEGDGGHVRGETVYVCEKYKFVFTGDILVNIKGFSDEQREFNILAPYLMTSVNVDSKKAKRSRELIMEQYKGYTLYAAHGGPMEN